MLVLTKEMNESFKNMYQTKNLFLATFCVRQKLTHPFVVYVKRQKIVCGDRRQKYFINILIFLLPGYFFPQQSAILHF